MQVYWDIQLSEIQQHQYGNYELSIGQRLYFIVNIDGINHKTTGEWLRQLCINNIQELENKIEYMQNVAKENVIRYCEVNGLKPISYNTYDYDTDIWVGTHIKF